MNLYRVDSSIRAEGSASREIADLVEAEWRAVGPQAQVTRRDLGAEPLPASAWADAVMAGQRGLEDRTADQGAAVALASRLVDELEAADALLIAVPLYNFGVSQHLKAWIDLVTTDGRIAGGAAAVRGKPAVLAIVRGGNYSPGTPRDGWDHATDYYRRIFVDVWGLDLHVVERQFTLVGVNPALDEFKELAEELREKAVHEARSAGRRLGAALAS